MSYTFALAGNPNSGKTTMFNAITGSTQYVGNWPGVTVEKKEGKARRFKEDIRIVDLPGIYSLSPYSLEEIVARDYIVDERPNVVINIVDGTNIERNLYLTTQLMELGVPVVVALNMMDSVESAGDVIDVEALEKHLGIPVVPTSASKGKGVRELVEKALSVAQSAPSCSEAVSCRFFEQKIEFFLDDMVNTMAGHLPNKNINPRWAALKILEQDEKVTAKLGLSAEFLGELNKYRINMEKEFGSDLESMLADNRYKYIGELVQKTVKKKAGKGELTISDKIDRLVTNRVLAIPIFLALMYGVFTITFGAIGSYTIDWVDGLINVTVAEALSGWLQGAGAADWLHALIINGILGGMGSMLVFVPQIMILFLFLAILEDSGYMARAAFVMDKFLRKLGLSGKSFIPMLMGFGCSVPAVMAARTLENDKDRKLTIILTPFMSCGARLPVYALFTAAFFAQNQSGVIFSIYLLGIVVAILSGIILKKTLFKGEIAPFVMELPPYRIPTVKGVGIHMWDRGKAFVKKAGTIIFAAAVIIWFMQTFNFSLHMVEDPAQSMFGIIGTAIAPLFAPLGFGEWQASVALLTGLVAKEVVVATMGILYGIGDVGDDTVKLAAALHTYFTPLTAYAFMAFTLLYMPCIAAFGAIKRELNSWKWTLFALAFQTGIAWIMAFVIYQGGRLLGFE
ncbi:ferrous iron transport protein B [Candidatus Formimonas warabiya]|uniref:Ferrous iron transport protein B n=1 Tax=Formimonas warabiya TaxID=1761012 RepID=A0A3G1KYM9_FORW1|nr:ferrous iron transport protein B [Candidatus Formimonas warabiya]ATW27551.1 ferrous iron transport protein B [Candidatus Formimonas warabiya]